MHVYTHTAQYSSNLIITYARVTLKHSLNLPENLCTYTQSRWQTSTLEGGGGELILALGRIYGNTNTDDHRIAGNFRMVEIVVHFVLNSITRKFPCTIMSICSTSLCWANIKNTKFKLVVHTKICTTENYPLYGIHCGSLDPLPCTVYNAAHLTPSLYGIHCSSLDPLPCTVYTAAHLTPFPLRQWMLLPLIMMS